MACKKSYDKDNASFSFGNGFKTDGVNICLQIGRCI